MGRSLFVALLLAGFGGEPPDGQLVLGVHGHGEWAVVTDPRGRTTRKRRLPGGALCHGPLLAVGDRVIFSGYRGRRAVARALPLTLGGPARSLGRADTFARSATPGRLWLGRWRQPHGRVLRWSNRPVPVALRELDESGSVRARAQAVLPRFSSFHAALTGGFLATEDRWLTLRRPDQERPVTRIRDGRVMAAGASRFAWCRGDCTRFHVWSRRGVRTLIPPRGVRPLGSEGAFSPDERRLATAVTVDGRTRVAVVDVRSGVWTLVPGGASGGYSAIAWSPSGRWVYFTEGDMGLRAWRVGASHAVALPIRPGGAVLSIAAAP